MRPFQIILFAIFGALALGGLLMFAAFRGFDREADPLRAGVTIWGPLDQGAFNEILGQISGDDERWGLVRYTEQDPRTFSDTLINAIAEGNGPDLVLIPHDLLVTQAAKLTPISYEDLSVREFRDAFVEGAEVFLFPSGVYGIPLAVDPLLMYWNRDIFASARLAYPPRTWEEMVLTTVPAVTVRRDNNDIARSALAFGEYANVQNAKAVLLMLMLQAGSQLVEITNNNFLVRLNTGSGTEVSTPADSAVRFFTQFANPATVTYSWNRGMPRDRDAFLAEDLALYFGFGSEFGALKDGNANLNFDVAPVPQGDDVSDQKGYGTMYAFSIPKASKNPQGAYEVAMRLTLGDANDALVRRLGLAPARRDLIELTSGSAVGDVVYRSALITRAWLDPNPLQSDNVFKEMIEAVTSGRTKVSEAIENATYKLQKAF